jgi:hypothetical protein
MWPHFVSLFLRSWDNFTASLGSTTLGFFSPFLVPVVGVCVFGYVAHRREGWSGVRAHFGKTLSLAALVAILAECIVYTPLFVSDVVRVIYTDHQDLVRVNQALVHTNSTLMGEIQGAKNSKPSPKDVPKPQFGVLWTPRGLSVHNTGESRAFYLFGWKRWNGPPRMLGQPLLVAPANQEEIRQEFKVPASAPVSGSLIVPYDLLLMDEDKQTKFVAKLSAVLTLSSGNIAGQEMHTLDVSIGGW